jgi:hypothetical protein
MDAYLSGFTLSCYTPSPFHFQSEAIAEQACCVASRRAIDYAGSRAR